MIKYNSNTISKWYDGTNNCGSGVEAATDPIELIFSNTSCFDYINRGATVSGTIKLYIYS